MNRPDEIDSEFAAAGAPIKNLMVVAKTDDPTFPLHVYEPEIGWIVWSNPWMN